MRLVVAMTLALFVAPVGAAEVLDNVESPVYEADGTRQQIAQRAEACASRVLRFDAVTGKDATASVMSPGIGSASTATQQVDGGKIVEHADLEAGLVVANQRTATGGVLSGGDVLQSTLTVEARDGRFRITHTNISRMAKSTGYMENPGFTPVYIQAFSGAEKVRKQLLGVSDKLAECITKPAEDW